MIRDDEVGTIINFRVHDKTTDQALATLPLLSQEQAGYKNGEAIFTLTDLDTLRAGGDAPTQVAWTITQDHVGMGIIDPSADSSGTEIPTSEFQAANPIFILIFGLVFSTLWTFLGRRGSEPSTPAKFAFGLLQLGLGFGALWYGAYTADTRGMVGLTWLLLGYMLHTTGELCLSPVGLSMVTKLSPAKIVSTVMGSWFLATAFAGAVGGIIAKLTNVGGSDGVNPAPIDTVGVYGDVFAKIAIVAIISAIICFALTPKLKRWMQIGVDDETVA